MTLTTLTAATAVAPRGDSRLLAAGGPTLVEHVARFGSVPNAASAHLLDDLQASGLAGRGGAAFPLWRKIASARVAGAAAPVVIANGAEGEPVSSKDAVLLQRAPHLVIDGLMLVGALLGATELYVYVGAHSVTVVRRAVAERSDAASVIVREAPESFVAGEASAVVNMISHRRPVPFDHIRPLSELGLGGRPTVVQNVETLANVALIARFGPAWFRSVGNAHEPGTRLLSFGGAVPRPGVVEVAGGLPIDVSLARSGVDLASVRAVLVGGYHGAWVPSAAFATPLTRAALEPFGATPGAGILVALGRGSCGIRESARIATYLAGQSARQCGPCVNGLPALARTLSSIAEFDRSSALDDEVRRLGALVTGRGTCHHPDGTARLVLSTLTIFADDVRAHAAGYCLEEAS